MLRVFVLVLMPLLIACGSSRIQVIDTPFDQQLTSPPPPDYRLSQCWAALPDKRDAADSVPLRSKLKDEQAAALADVFFVHPTIYTDKPYPRHPWNADVNDSVMNRQIQITTILNQATIFNGSCRVYAPYYRQAHLYAFYTTHEVEAKKALELAYQDVKAAFVYYLQHYNQGRPLVIASHSQGTYHATRLMQEFVDGKELQNQLVVAYLVGRPVPADVFKKVNPVERPEETGVWASWNTFARGYIPRNYDRYYHKALSVNPMLWNTSDTFADKEMNKGGVGLNFTMIPNLTDAQNHQNLLWINRPYVKGRAWLRTKIWHRADLNLFYLNVRENVALRIESFLAR